MTQTPARLMLAVLGIAGASSVAIAAADTDRLKSAIDLPQRAQALRADVPEDEVRQVLKAARQHGLAAGDAGALLEETGKAVKESGNIDNFGSFVKSKLDEGLRGKDLAEAIHAEHNARGKGKPEHAGKGGKGDERKDDSAKDGEGGSDQGKDKDNGSGNGNGKSEKGKGSNKGQKGKGSN